MIQLHLSMENRIYHDSDVFIQSNRKIMILLHFGVVGWCEGAGKLTVPGRPTNLDNGRARAYCACSRCGWGVVWTFFLSSIFSFLSPCL